MRLALWRMKGRSPWFFPFFREQMADAAGEIALGIEQCSQSIDAASRTAKGGSK
jgi:hypothetical protein